MRVFITGDVDYPGEFDKAKPFLDCLEELNLPFTLFICTKQGGTELAEFIEPLKTYKNINVGSHGTNHVHFNNLNFKETRDNVMNSKKYLEEHVKRVDCFRTPFLSRNWYLALILMTSSYKNWSVTMTDKRKYHYFLPLFNEYPVLVDDSQLFKTMKLSEKQALKFSLNLIKRVNPPQLVLNLHPHRMGGYVSFFKDFWEKLAETRYNETRYLVDA